MRERERGLACLMGAEDGGEGVQLHPSSEERLAPLVPYERDVDGAVASDVAVVEREVGQAATEQARDAALDAIVVLPADHLVPFPHQHRPPRAFQEPRPHEEHQPVVFVSPASHSLTNSLLIFAHSSGYLL